MPCHLEGGMLLLILRCDVRQSTYQQIPDTATHLVTLTATLTEPETATATETETEAATSACSDNCQWSFRNKFSSFGCLCVPPFRSWPPYFGPSDLLRATLLLLPLLRSRRLTWHVCASPWYWLVSVWARDASHLLPRQDIVITIWKKI